MICFSKEACLLSLRKLLRTALRQVVQLACHDYDIIRSKSVAAFNVSILVSDVEEEYLIDVKSFAVVVGMFRLGNNF
jgi:hypothetical protein